MGVLSIEVYINMSMFGAPKVFIELFEDLLEPQYISLREFWMLVGKGDIPRRSSIVRVTLRSLFLLEIKLYIERHTILPALPE